MRLSDEVKEQILQRMEAAHRVEANGLMARLRIFGWSLKDVADCLLRAEAAPFLSIAEPKSFDMRAAEAIVANADVLMAEAAGLPHEYIVVLDVVQGDYDHLIAASVGDEPEAPAVAALVSIAGSNPNTAHLTINMIGWQHTCGVRQRTWG